MKAFEKSKVAGKDLHQFLLPLHTHKKKQTKLQNRTKPEPNEKGTSHSLAFVNNSGNAPQHQ